MQVTETLSAGLKRSYAVVLPAADIEGKRDTRLKELSRTLRLPGFRPGKVPASLVRQRFGTAVTAEVLEESVNTATEKVLSDRGLRAASQPRVDVKQADPDKDVAFDVEVELLPEIAMPDFGSLEVVRMKAEAPAAEVDRSLENIARRQRELTDVTEDRGA